MMWFSDNNRPTKFFHKMAAEKRFRGGISYLRAEGSAIEDPVQIQQHVV